jgi:hypothetical protein
MEVFHEFSEAIRSHVGDAVHRLFLADFSTTGPVERCVSEIVLLDVFQPYFEYVLRCICGIPEITLEGSAADWRHLRSKVDQLEHYELDSWLRRLRPLCDQFVRAAEGEVDRAHWQNIYKLVDAYGGDTINGWIGQLFPYIRNSATGCYSNPNPLLENDVEGIRSENFPPGLSRVPFICLLEDDAEGIRSETLPPGLSRVPFIWQGPTSARAMEFLGGTVGVTQDGQTLALRPKLGWAVRELPGLDQLLLQLRQHQTKPPLAPDALYTTLRQVCHGLRGLPGDLLRFYKECNGAALFPTAGKAVYSIRPLEGITEVKVRGKESLRVFRGAILYRFCDLADGTYLASWLNAKEQGHCQVVHCDDLPLEVVARSFTEFLQQALASEGKLYFQAAGFVLPRRPST